MGDHAMPGCPGAGRANEPFRWLAAEAGISFYELTDSKAAR